MLYNKIYRRFCGADPVALVCITALILISLYSLYVLGENNMTYAITQGFSSKTALVQAVSALIGMAAFIIVLLLGEKNLKRLTPFVFVISFVLTTLTLTPLGVTVDDDKAWLSVYGISLQPSEILKAAMIMTLSLVLSSHLRKMTRMLLFSLISLSCCILIFMQRDMGTLLIFLCIIAVMLFGSGLNKSATALSIIALPIAGTFAWKLILNQDQKSRILSSLDPSLDPYGVGFQQLSARNAITDGGLTGRLFDDTKSFVYVSSSHNDFILSFVAQLFGFAGVALVCLLLAVLVSRIARTENRSEFVSLVSTGVFAAFSSQAIINTAMNLSLFPVVGIVLPFVSAGGTAVICAYIMTAAAMTTNET